MLNTTFSQQLSNQELGVIGEQLAIFFLTQKNYTIITQNYRSPMGEIDIVCRNEEYLVFVEVKMRRTSQYGSPLEAITVRKQRQISRTAAYFLSKNDVESDIRFDVVIICFAQEAPPQIEHISNAFEFIE